MCWRRRIGIALLGLALVSSAQASVVNYWRFEDGSGSLVADSTGLADGILDPYFPTTTGAGDSGELGWSTNTLFSIVPQTQAANLGSLHFAPGPGVTLSPTAPMNYGANFTVEFFFSLDSLPSIVQVYISLSFHDGTTWMQFELNRLVNGNCLFTFGGSDSGEGGSGFFGSTELSLSLSTWYHFAFVKSGSSYGFFLDGLSIGNGSLNPGQDGSYIFGISGNYYIGTDNFSGGFDGFLDEIRISDEALEPSQFLNAPEPSTFVLTTLAISILMALRKRCCHEAAD